MSLKDKLVIKNKDYSEPLNSVLPDSLQETKTVNQSWQLQFSAYDDKSVAFSLLKSQNSVMWRGQEFIIKQIQPTYTNSLNTTQVTATHIGYEVQRVFQHKSNTGTKTYSVNDVLSFYLSGNDFGYSWEVHGNFDNQQIENLGNSNGQDMLSKITSTWSNAVITFDNKKIKVYNVNDYYKDNGKVITYLGNTNQVQLNYDSTNLVNKLYCLSDNSGDGEDSKPAFNPFYVTDDDSIKKYGVYEGQPVSDNRFNNADAMKKYAQSQLQPEPSLSIQVQFNADDEDIDIGEIRTLIIPELDLTTQVKVTQTTTYPLSDTQQSQAQLDNTAQTILNYNNSLKNALSGRTSGLSSSNTAINNAIQNNQDEINKINESLKQQTQSISNSDGTITFTLNNGVVYVNCVFTTVKSGDIWNVPNGYTPKSSISGSLIVNLDKNYIINYSITNGNFTIQNIADLQGNSINSISSCTADFNYLI
ncbi:prophage endopeptidase tail family protein [Ligilactobacillus sp. LYQ135]